MGRFLPLRSRLSCGVLLDFGVPNLERDTELVGVLKQKVWFNLQKVLRISSKSVPDCTMWRTYLNILLVAAAVGVM